MPADAAADWRQWMRRALAHYQRYPPPTAPPVTQPLASRGVPTVTEEELAAREAAAAQLREQVNQLFAARGLPPPQPAPRAAPEIDPYTAFRNRVGALFGRAPTSAEC